MVRGGALLEADTRTAAIGVDTQGDRDRRFVCCCVHQENMSNK